MISLVLRTEICLVFLCPFLITLQRKVLSAFRIRSNDLSRDEAFIIGTGSRK